MEKAKYGKMRQVNAVNGSKMVVKLRGSYYRRVKEKARRKAGNYTCLFNFFFTFSMMNL